MVGDKNNFLASTSYVIAKISGINIQQTTLPIRLLNLSMLIMDFGDAAGVDYKKVDDDQDRELDNAFRGIAQMKTMEEKAKEPELTLSPIASPEDTPDTTQGLMTKPTEEKIEESA